MHQSPTGSLGWRAQPLGLAARRITPTRLVALARLGEWALALMAFVVAAAWFGVGSATFSSVMPAFAVAISGLWLGMLLSRPMSAAPLGGYDSVRGAWIWAILALFGLALAAIPGFAMIGFAAIAPALWRACLVVPVRKLVQSGRIALGVAVAGGGQEARMTLHHLLALRAQGVQVLGLFDDRDGARSPMVQLGIPRLGRMADLPDFTRNQPVDLVVVTMPPRAEERIAQILAPLWVLPVDIRLAPYDTKLALRPRSYRWMGDLALLDLFDRPLRARDAALKRGVDLCLCAVITTLTLPLMGLIALAIRLDSPGPILFRQRREGYVGAPFTALKFRSLQDHRRDDGAVVPVVLDDERVTRVGRFLRRSSLDELPQLFNVLRGEMSLVGPRPHAVGARSRDMAFAAVAAGYAARHRVKPGLTGLAQVRGLRGAVIRPEDIRRRLACDLEYIDTWSPWLDMRIMAQTVPAILLGENAY